MSFKEIIGQEKAVSILKVAYRHHRLAHAYVFVGPDGVGKSTTALNFARLLVCENPKIDEPCEKCPACLKAKALNHPDIQWLSPDGQFIKIDSIREACRRLNLKSFESRTKVLIISQAGHLNEESSNALLKTLEEPTPDTVIILLARSLKSILPTIASRCQRVVFSSLNEEALVSILRNQYKMGEPISFYLARISGGSLGVALQCAQDELYARKNKIIDEALDSRCSLEKFMNLSAADRTERALKINEALGVLSTWFRDLLLAKVSHDKGDFINIDRREEILAVSRRFSFFEIEERISAIAEAAVEIEHNINARISLTKLRVELWK